MTARVVVVRHDAALARWEIGEEPWVGRAPSPGLVGTQVMEVAGRVREIVVDAERPTGADLATIRSAFGPVVADAVRAHPPGEDLDVVVEVGDPTVALDGRPAGPVGRSPSLPDEPGRPARATGAAGTTADISGHPAVIEVDRPEVTVERAGEELVVRVRGLEVGDDVWVRVSSAGSGSIVSVGRLRPRVDDTGARSGTPTRGPRRGRSVVPFAEARMTYGFDADPDELHVTITDEPLAPVGTLADRRGRWCDHLLDRADRARRRRPARALADAERAVEITVALGDPARHRRATSLASAIRRRRWAYRSIAAILVLAVIGAAAWWWLGDDPSPDGSTWSGDDAPAASVAPDTASGPTVDVTTPTTTPTTMPATTATPTTTAVPTTTAAPTTTASPAADPGFPGPTAYRFENDESIVLVLTGRRPLDDGTTRLELEGRETFRGLMDYSTPENCRASVSVPAAGTTGVFPPPIDTVVRLVPVNGGVADGRTTIIAGTIRFDADLVESSVIPETCGTVGDLETGAWGEALFRRDTAVAGLELEEPLAPGLWRVELAGTEGRSTTPTPEPIVLRVANDG